MITSVKIKDNTKTPFEYASDIEAFENHRRLAPMQRRRGRG